MNKNKKSELLLYGSDFLFKQIALSNNNRTGNINQIFLLNKLRTTSKERPLLNE